MVWTHGPIFNTSNFGNRYWGSCNSERNIIEALIVAEMQHRINFIFIFLKGMKKFLSHFPNLKITHNVFQGCYGTQGRMAYCWNLLA
jgi:hypothetical protein